MSGVMAASGFPLAAGGGVEAGGVEGVWADSPKDSSKTARVNHGKLFDPEAAERMKFLHQAS